MRIWDHRDRDLVGYFRDVFESTDFSLRRLTLRLSPIRVLLHDPLAFLFAFFL